MSARGGIFGRRLIRERIAELQKDNILESLTRRLAVSYFTAFVAIQHGND
ncbi:MAG: hypothetical protein AB1861_15945 [Cyanobacteriota bacterium]